MELVRADQSAGGVAHERSDAARNRRLLLDAARALIAERTPGEITTDDIAAAAGVGKGTLFRRFGSRVGLMIELLDEDERAMQQAFLFGPPPMGPQAPPLQRLLAFGRERLRFVEVHRAILEEVLLNVMYDVPSRKDIAKVIITAEAVRDRSTPTLVPIEITPAKAPSRARRTEQTA